MSRISLSILTAAFATLLTFPFSSKSVAGVTISTSNERQLSLRWSAESVSTQSSLSSASQSSRSELSSFAIDDSLVIDANVICFWSPSREVRFERSDIVVGRRVEGVSTALTDGPATQIQIVEPVLVRGRWLGKIIVPKIAYQGSEWYEVAAAEVEIAFGQDTRLEVQPAAGPLDRILDDLAVNSAEAKTWSAIAKAATPADIYNPFAQSSNWVRVAITASGVYKITRTDLANAGVSVGTLDPRSIRVFHGGGRPLPNSNETPHDSLTEMAVTIFGESDGNFGDQDFLMFYANGGDFNTWDNNTPGFIRHPYSDRNVYYMSFGGNFTEPAKRMPVVESVIPNVDDTVTQFTDYIHFEEDAQLSSSGGDVFDYYNWYWGLAGDITLFVNLPQPLAQSVNRFSIRTTRPTFNLRLNNIELSRDSSNGNVHSYTSDRFTTGLNQIAIDYPFNDGYTDDVFIELQRALTLPADGELVFTGTGNGSLRAYKISGQFATPYLLDIRDLHNQNLLTASVSANQLVFSELVLIGEAAPCVVVNAAALRTPLSLVSAQIDDIKAASNGADLIVITHDNFYASAQEYVAYRQTHDNLRVRTVRISDVYAQFAGGRLDPIAIRDFLRHAYYNWSGAKPSYCLLIGDGVYDFRNNLGTGGVNYVPPYIVDADETVSDENFVFLDSLYDLDSDNSYPADRGVDMVIARWPVKTTAEFQTVFDKMKRYDEGEDAGSWRNMITLIADDENHPQSSLPEIFHTQDTEVLANTIIPPTFVLDKIYGISYPFGAAAEKPLMREDIIRAINDGRLIVNYTGHGNQNLWADERIFRRTQDIPRLNNLARQPLIFNASCSIGFFDDPRSEGMAEDLLRYANGGAVGTISATRLVYSRPNFEFNKAGMTQLLSDKNYTIAEATFVTKLLRQGGFGVGDNDRKYIYIGDPLTRLAVPPNEIQYVIFEPDSLVALTVTELAAEIVDRDGIKQTGFDGTATVSVFDNSRERSVSIPFGSGQLTVSYTEYGPEIYRGQIAVNDGDFNLKFVVPKDITYGGDDARISGYAAGSGTGAAGAIFPISIGSINKEVVDSVGPEITLLLAGSTALTDGATVTPGSELSVELFDSLGINLSGEIGHGIEVQFDDNREFSYELTDSFTYAADSYQRGSAKMKLPNLAAGEHTLRVKAWDSANNSNQKVVSLNVSSSAELEIRDLLCYPNPVQQGCEFSYTLSADADDVTLKLFTLSGLEIWSLGSLPGARGYHQGISWNGLDTDGDHIANGVYVIQLSARPTSGNGEIVDNNKATATGKLVVLK